MSSAAVVTDALRVNSCVLLLELSMTLHASQKENSMSIALNLDHIFVYITMILIFISHSGGTLYLPINNIISSFISLIKNIKG